VFCSMLYIPKGREVAEVWGLVFSILGFGVCFMLHLQIGREKAEVP